MLTLKRLSKHTMEVNFLLEIVLIWLVKIMTFLDQDSIILQKTGDRKKKARLEMEKILIEAQACWEMCLHQGPEPTT